MQDREASTSEDEEIPRPDDGGNGAPKSHANDVDESQGMDVGSDGEGNGSRRVMGLDAPILVPTKTEDGGSQGGSNAADVATGSQHDPFLHFSDINVRMSQLLGLGDAGEDGWRNLVGFEGRGNRRRLAPQAQLNADKGNDVGSDEGAHENANEADANEADANEAAPRRRTRLSFEVHISLFDVLWLQGRE